MNFLKVVSCSIGTCFQKLSNRRSPFICLSVFYHILLRRSCMDWDKSCSVQSPSYSRATSTPKQYQFLYKEAWKKHFQKKIITPALSMHSKAFVLLYKFNLNDAWQSAEVVFFYYLRASNHRFSWTCSSLSVQTAVRATSSSFLFCI